MDPSVSSHVSRCGKLKFLLDKYIGAIHYMHLLPSSTFAWQEHAVHETNRQGRMSFCSAIILGKEVTNSERGVGGTQGAVASGRCGGGVA